MIDYAKEVLMERFIENLKKELSEKIKDNTIKDSEQLIWLLKESTLKFAWFPVTERQSEEYKKYKRNKK